MFYRDIRNLEILSNEDLDFVKTKTEKTALSSFRQYNKNPQQNLSKEELAALTNLNENKDIVIQKSDKGNSVIIVDKDTYIKRMENLLSDQRKFEKVTLKNDAFLNFVVNQEKRIDTIFKNLVHSNSMSKEMRKFVKPVGTRPGIMYGNCKVHKQQVDGCPLFRPILSALQTPTYNLAKFLVPILNPLTKNEYTVKDSFQFAEEICEQDPTLTMGTLDVESLFTNIPLDETIDICINQLFENTDTVEGFKKSELKQLLCLATKESYFIFNGLLYKQIDGVAMGSPLGTSLANAFLSYYEKNWLNNCPQGFKPVFYRRYVDDIFLLFKSNEHLKYFQDFLNSCHINMSFSMETEKENKLSFLDVEVIREQGKFTTTVYRKPTFSGVYSNFESFLPSVYKFGMVYTLVYRCFRISSNRTQFYTELTFLKGIFRKNGYPENLIDKCFKKFLNNVHLVKENVPTVEKKRLFLVLPYLGIISLQTSTKLQQALKGVLNSCKLEIVLKCQARLSNFFRYKDPIPKDLISGVVYKFQCGLCNESYYGESIRHLDIRSGEHISVSPLTGKKVKPSNNSAICDHLLHCNFLPSFDNFSVLAYENKKYLLGIKESLLIMRDKPSLNRNINSAPLYLFDKVS